MKKDKIVGIHNKSIHNSVHESYMRLRIFEQAKLAMKCHVYRNKRKRFR